MSNNIASPLRRRPGYQIIRRLKAAGVTQDQIAAAAKCSQTTVSDTLNRRGGVSDALRERVWAEIERRLA